MEKYEIAFVSFPHPPEVNPTISIVEALVRRGHHVTYATSKRFATRIAATGADVILCPAFDPRSIFTSSSAQDVEVSQPVFRLAKDTLSILQPAFENSRPDLIVYDVLALAGRIMAKKQNIPAIQTSPIFALDEGNFIAQVPDPTFRREELDYYTAVDRFLYENGITSTRSAFYREKLNIHLFPRAIQIPGDVFGSEFFYAGRCAAEQPFFGQWRTTRSDIPSVLISNSTTFSQGPEFFRMCIEAFTGLGWHLILSTGESFDPDLLSPLPDHVEIVQNNSHVQILPHVSLFICPGGIVTQAEAAYHGVPLIAMSHGVLELEWVSDNISRLGTGIHIRRADTNALRIRQAVLEIGESQRILDNVRHLREVVRRDAGGEETANRIDEFLEVGA